MHKKLKQNPVIKEAMDAHQKDREQNDHLKPRQCVTEVLSRMSRKKPPTKSQVQVCYFVEILKRQYKKTTIDVMTPTICLFNITITTELHNNNSKQV